MSFRGNGYGRSNPSYGGGDVNGFSGSNGFVALSRVKIHLTIFLDTAAAVAAATLMAMATVVDMAAAAALAVVVVTACPLLVLV
jgi:hypothetical protein